MLISPCRSLADHIYVYMIIVFKALDKAINARKIILTIVFNGLGYVEYTIKRLQQKTQFCKS